MSSESPAPSLKYAADTLTVSKITSNGSLNFDKIALCKVLSKAKFVVLLGCLPSEKKKFAVKVFPFDKDQPDSCFLNEIQFKKLRHKNVISILHYELEREATYANGSCKTSYIIMELAPHGDLHDFLLSGKVQFDDKLARTFFHQLIAGVEYLHSVGVAHLDLKPENLLLGDNYQLKIGDFDQAYLKGYNKIVTKGTVNYRAPELVERRCKNPKAADIYSAGIILFVMKCNGILPYAENSDEGIYMFQLMMCNPESFWKDQIKLQGKDCSELDTDFKELFMSMVAFDPKDRMSIQQIKESKWFNKPVYTPNELESLIGST